jgi:hypothetical protein
MSKVVNSHSKKWPGTITLCDPMTLSQAAAWETAIGRAQKVIDARDGGRAAYDFALLPGVFACVEKWDLKGLENVTLETFPLKPHKERAALLAFLIGEITELYKDTEVPNE